MCKQLKEKLLQALMDNMGSVIERSTSTLRALKSWNSA